MDRSDALPAQARATTGSPLPLTAFPLKKHLAETFALLTRLTKHKGFCWAGNRRLAEMRGCSIDTITRHIAALELMGLIGVLQQPGIRRIITIIRASVRPKNAATLRQKCGKNADTLPITQYTKTDNRQEAPAPPVTASPCEPAVVVVNEEFTDSEKQCASQLEARGIHPPTARRLIKDYGETKCRLQLAALSMRNAKDTAGLLVASIRDDYPIKPPEKPSQPHSPQFRATDSVPYTPPVETCSAPIPFNMADFRRQHGFKSGGHQSDENSH